MLNAARHDIAGLSVRSPELRFEASAPPWGARPLGNGHAGHAA